MVHVSLTLNIEKLDATWRVSFGVGTVVSLVSHPCFDIMYIVNQLLNKGRP